LNKIDWLIEEKFLRRLTVDSESFIIIFWLLVDAGEVIQENTIMDGFENVKF